jgi:hypothetical protein
MGIRFLSECPQLLIIPPLPHTYPTPFWECDGTDEADYHHMTSLSWWPHLLWLVPDWLHSKDFLKDTVT